MNRIRMTIAFAATLLVAQYATAQMTGGGNDHGMNGGMTRGGMNPGGMTGAAMGQVLAVGTDGVLYTLRRSAASTTEVPAVDVVAITPAGTQSWSTKVEGRMTRLELSGTLVFVASGVGDMAPNGARDDNDASRLVALSAATGTVQWTLELDGRIASLESYPGGVYALLMRRDGTSSGSGMHRGATAMTRSIAAIDNSGKLLWVIDLN